MAIFKKFETWVLAAMVAGLIVMSDDLYARYRAQEQMYAVAGTALAAAFTLPVEVLQTFSGQPVNRAGKQDKHRVVRNLFLGDWLYCDQLVCGGVYYKKPAKEERLRRSKEFWTHYG